ncbi:MAG: DUF2975 domain-containing protein [Clostridia bacterium]|nr:DUF2975 domain-containing protein [Clostridia bacterium]
MNWTKDKSLVLSQVCVAAFSALLVVIDVFAVTGAGRYSGSVYFVRGEAALPMGEGRALIIALMLCSVFAYIALWQLWRLLAALRRGRVFTEENVRRMRVVSWCCFAVAGICLVAGAFMRSLWAVAMAAAFMALIVRIVKNAFQQAVAMKSELDLTV